MDDNLEKTLVSLEKPKTSSEELEAEGHLTIDVYQNQHEIIVQSAIAGVSGNNMDIDIAKDTITIKGWRQRAEEIHSDNYLHRELHWGKFSRSIILPTEINVDQAKASIKNGLLTIRLPKLSREI